MKCCYCPKTTDLRPYGPGCAMVCFRCAMATPERKTEAEGNFAVQLRGIDGPALIDGTETGPYPLKHGPKGLVRVVAQVVQPENQTEELK